MVSPTVSAPPARYRPSDRLKRRADFRRVQSSRKRAHTKHYLLVVAPKAGPQGRFGVTVTKKIGNAVARNRVKRVMREVFRRNRDLFPAADVVVIAKRGAPRLGYHEALAELRKASPALFRAAGDAS